MVARSMPVNLSQIETSLSAATIAQMPEAAIDALYVHVPFCATKCQYCDFYSLPGQSADQMHAFVDCVLQALVREVARLLQLFLEANLLVTFATEHEFLLALDAKDAPIGGLFYRQAGPDAVQLEKIVIARKHRGKGIADGLVRVSVALAGAYVGLYFATMGQRYLLSWVGQRVLTNLRSALFDHLQRLSMVYHDTHIVGVTISRLISDVGVINDLFARDSWN